MSNIKKTLNLKKFISLLMIMLVLLFSVCVAGFSVSAADTQVKSGSFGYFDYEISEGEVCITKFNGDGGDVFIPNVIEDMPVVAIAEEAFWYCKDITAVSMPSNLEYIGTRAFQGCASLEEIVLPDTVIEIAAAAFCDCTNLRSVNIPAELLYVGAFAFDNTPWITRFEDNTSIILGGRILYKYLGDAEVVNIPQGVTAISGNAFQDKKNLTYVNIPDSLLFVGDYAFIGCDNLKSVSLSDNIYYMGICSFGYRTVTESGENDIIEDFVLYAPEDSLPADYAKEYGLTWKASEEFVPLESLPEAESCTAKELEDDTKDNSVWIGNSNSIITLVIIVVSCVGIVGGLYGYFAIKEKKNKKSDDKKHNNKKK